MLLGPWRINALSWLGNVSVGLLAAIAWDASPWGLALVAVPLGLLFVAYRGWMAQTVENELMEDIAQRGRRDHARRQPRPRACRWARPHRGWPP